MSFVVWFTGLSGSGKSSAAESLVCRLTELGLDVEHLDGESVRKVFPTIGFRREDVNEHLRRIGFLASRLEHHGVCVVASFISPYSESRDFARALCKKFVLVHVATPIAECVRRDRKGIYERARNGDITCVAGIDIPYETPQNAELTLDASQESVEDSTDRIIQLLDPWLVLTMRHSQP